MRAAVVLVSLVLGSCSCSTVRQLKPAESVAVDAPTQKTRTDDALDYSVAVSIHAPPETVWKIITDAPAFPSWNSTIVKLEGTIAPGEKIKLVSKDAPDQTFALLVSTFEPAKRMVWEDGGSMFLGVRNFTLMPKDGGTIFVMSETFSGGMLGMIEGSLPDFTKSFDTFAADLKKAAEAAAPAAAPAPTPPTTPPAAEAPPAATTTP